MILWEEGAAELLMSLPAVGTYVTGSMGTASPFILLGNPCLMLAGNVGGLSSPQMVQSRNIICVVHDTGVVSVLVLLGENGEAFWI